MKRTPFVWVRLCEILVPDHNFETLAAENKLKNKCEIEVMVSSMQSYNLCKDVMSVKM